MNDKIGSYSVPITWIQMVCAGPTPTTEIVAIRNPQANTGEQADQ